MWISNGAGILPHDRSPVDQLVRLEGLPVTMGMIQNRYSDCTLPNRLCIKLVWSWTPQWFRTVLRLTIVMELMLYDLESWSKKKVSCRNRGWETWYQQACEWCQMRKGRKCSVSQFSPTLTYKNFLALVLKQGTATFVIFRHMTEHTLNRQATIITSVVSQAGDCDNV